MRRTRTLAPEQKSTRLPIPEGCLISEWSNGQSGIYGMDDTEVCGGVNPTRMSRVQCGPAGELPDDAPASEWRTGRNGPGLRTEPAGDRRRSGRERGDAARARSRSGNPGLGCEDGMTFLNGSVEWGI